MAVFAPGTSANPSAEVELTLSCRDLRNMDYFSKSDPMVVVYYHDVIAKMWRMIGRTEVIMNNLNPDFATKIVLEYRFEQQQLLRFDVFDIDTPNLNMLEEHDFLGNCVTSLGQIVSSGKMTLDLGSGSKQVKLGTLLIVAEELSTCKDEVCFKLTARNLRRKWWWMWPNEHLTYLEVHKVDESGSHSLVYRTKTSRWSASPSWGPIMMSVRSLCSGDFDRSIRIRCLSHRTIGASRLIGEGFLTLRQLRSATDGEEFPLVSAKKSGQLVGALLLSNFQIKKVHSFLEFVLGGMQIHCTVAIDFTASNGNPDHDISLHYIHDSSPNPYEQALRAVVEILQDYDSDKQFPVLGFGARIPPQGLASHCFFVNLHAESPFCAGVEGVMTAYKQCIREVQLYGPTNFSPVIAHVTQYARTYQDGSQYFILLIVTDGVITDMHQTKQAIIAASDLPLSIIIVGVGQADFSAMSELDGDEVPLSVGGRTAVRDIVQFVPFREVQQVRDPVAARALLAQEVLAEIPGQVVGFMRSRGFHPGTQGAAAAPPLEPPPPYSETEGK